MAYMNQELKATISTALKPVLAKYGVKGTLSVRNHSTIVLTIKSGKIDFIGNCDNVRKNNPQRFGYDVHAISPNTTGCQTVNQYWFHEHYDGVAKDFLSEAFDALKSAGWYDKSEAMVDYFDTAYYIDVDIGKWNQPYFLESN